MNKLLVPVILTSFLMVGCETTDVPDEVAFEKNPDKEVLKEDEILLPQKTTKAKKTKRRKIEKIENSAEVEDLILTDNKPRKTSPELEKRRKERAKKALKENELLDDAIDRDLIEDH